MTILNFKYMNYGRNENLTEREREIVQLLSNGENFAFIAQKIGIKLNTVYKHKQNIHRKLKVKNTIELLKSIGKI